MVWYSTYTAHQSVTTQIHVEVININRYPPHPPPSLHHMYTVRRRGGGKHSNHYDDVTND